MNHFLFDIASSIFIGRSLKIFDDEKNNFFGNFFSEKHFWAKKCTP